MRPAPIEIELGYRTYWFVRLRWVASSSIIWGTFAATVLTRLDLDAVPLYLIGAAVAIYNSLFLIALKLNEVEPEERRLRGTRLLANGQIVADLVSLTLLLHFAGGAENPITLYFVFHMVCAGILLTSTEAFLQATLAIVLYAALLGLELSGAVPHVHLIPATNDVARDPQFVLVAIVAFASTMYFTVYLSTSIASSLRRRDRDNQLLAAKLEVRASELRAANHNLQELERLKSAQLSRLSDELRHPLSSIHGWLDNLTSGVSGELSAPQQDLVSKAALCTGETLALLSDLQTLARAREGNLFSQRMPVDMGLVAREVVDGLGSLAGRRGVVLALEGESCEAAVLGDEAALRQMIAHLVSNAVEYTMSGGAVKVRVGCAGEVVQIRVEDTGIGIAQADLTKVFDEFYRAENGRRFRPHGAGLGLTIARSVAELHRGRIELDSTLGSGTNVMLLLPRSPAKLPGQSESTEGAFGASSSRA